MKTSFFGLNVALSGLYASQKSLDIVNHNITNASTVGYSRQVVNQKASTPIGLYDGTGMVGTGAEVEGAERIRDDYLDFKYWSENVANGEWSKKAELLSEIQTTFNEPTKSGFVTIMNDFFDSYQEMAKDPSSSAVRALVREKGVTLSKYFNNTATRFEKLQEDLNDQVRLDVEKINSLATQIQQINKQIYNQELDGNHANDLRDSRTLLVDELSKYINVQATEVSYGKLPNGADDIHFLLTVGGKSLVDHFNISKLTITQRTTKLNEEDIDNLYEVGWADGNKLEINGGELKGYLDIRDGNGQISSDPDEMMDYKGIPYYMKKAKIVISCMLLLSLLVMSTTNAYAMDDRITASNSYVIKNDWNPDIIYGYGYTTSTTYHYTSVILYEGYTACRTSGRSWGKGKVVNSTYGIESKLGTPYDTRVFYGF
jgi:flagellar hook-associated protein 1 FlgK